jgi:hypothetical protein
MTSEKAQKEKAVSPSDDEPMAATTRLDRLLQLLETGSSPATRRAAAHQIGEILSPAACERVCSGCQPSRVGVWCARAGDVQSREP